MEQSPPRNPQLVRPVLSERQLEVLVLVSKGLTSKEIGRHLAISPSTVDNHVKAAVDRLGAKNRHHAARYILTESGSPGGGVASTAATNARAFWRFPPLGGRHNDLTAGQRLYHIGQIAVLSIIAISAAILTIAGVVHVLSK